VAVRYIFVPLADILIVLERVEVCSLSVSFVVLDLTLVNAAIIEDVSPFALGFAESKGSLIVGAIFEKELAAAMKFFVCPLPSVVAFGFAHLLVAIAEDSFWV